ncbi:MAG: hypothetical protein K2I52_01305, partial [Muribaculaceae bacterium]|nr:hypothetical protein [Muribaculaceae bacterium]
RDSMPAADPLCIGNIGTLEEFIQKNEVYEIDYAESGENYASMKRVMRIADDHVVRFFYVPLLNAYVSRAAQLSNIGQVSAGDIIETTLASGTMRSKKI